MNDREEVQVARLLEDSVGSLSLNDSAASSNSPARCVVVRLVCLVPELLYVWWVGKVRFGSDSKRRDTRNILSVVFTHFCIA